MLRLEGDGYAWSFDRADLTDTEVPGGVFDAAVSMQLSEAVLERIRSYTGDAPMAALDTAFSGKLPGKAILELTVDAALFGNTRCGLFYLPETGDPERVATVEVGAVSYTHLGDKGLGPIAGLGKTSHQRALALTVNSAALLHIHREVHFCRAAAVAVKLSVLHLQAHPAKGSIHRLVVGRVHAGKGGQLCRVARFQRADEPGGGGTEILPLVIPHKGRGHGQIMPLRQHGVGEGAGKHAADHHRQHLSLIHI